MKNFVFLEPFRIERPTREEQNDFMMREIVNQVECADFGKFYTNNELYDKVLTEFIPQVVKDERPDWVIAEGECATVALGMKRRKKVLINPKVSFDSLNNVPDSARRNTYGFFDARHESDYERFQSVYPNAALYAQTDELTLFMIKDIVEAIINEE